jgi:hypothetical protein
MPSRYGRQPARAELLHAKRSLGGAAAELKIPRSHLRSAVLGYSPPSPGLRAGLPRLLGLPVEKLFTQEALDATYDPSRGPRASERRNEPWAIAEPSTRLWDAMVSAAAADPIIPISDEKIIAQVVALLATRSVEVSGGPTGVEEPRHDQVGRAS